MSTPEIMAERLLVLLISVAVLVPISGETAVKKSSLPQALICSVATNVTNIGAKRCLNKQKVVIGALQLQAIHVVTARVGLKPVPYKNMEIGLLVLEQLRIAWSNF
jgi:hypothetical protein